MPELSGFTSGVRRAARTVRAGRVARLAAKQHGIVSWRQLRSLGVSEAAICKAVSELRLFAIHPRVYAVGHRHVDQRGSLIAALLYAGSGSALSHTTAAWHWKILDSRPTTIHVSAPGDVESLPGVVAVHHPRRFHVVVRDGLRVTAVGRTLVDLAGMLDYGHVQKAVANASYRNLLGPTEAVSALKRGRRGSAALRKALAHMLPELARTLSPAEDLFVVRCDGAGLPSPEMNRKILGFKVDAVWRDRHLIVELDGGKAHGHPVAVRTDRSRDLRLRRAGWTVLRYSGAQLEHDWPLVLAELRSYLAAPELSVLASDCAR